MKSWQVWVFTGTDANPSSNGLRFATREDAESYALNLAMRWTAVRDWEVRESADEPNR
jgi:hypothetical protein